MNDRNTMTLAVDAAMVEMANIYPPLRRSECEQLIRAALSAGAPAAGRVPSDEEILELAERHVRDCRPRPTYGEVDQLAFARALLAQYGGSVRIAAEQEIIDAARNLVKVKGRFHTEGAYLRLINAVEDATGGSE